ncbi:MAG: calcium-binding protein [Rhodobacteraceae bacterium]|nr:calcium-binding protein [Paracoccaceae bacterium]
MPTYTTDVIQAGTVLDMDTTSETAYIASGTRVISTASKTIIGTDIYEAVVVHGELASQNNTVIDLDGDYSRVVIGSSGIVSNSVYGDFAAITLDGDGAQIYNAGTVSAGIGAWLTGSFGSVVNTGTIQGYGVSYNYWGAGLYLVDLVDNSINASYTVDNYGTITGTDRSIYAAEYAFFTYYASNTTVNNFGILNGIVELGLGDDTMINAGITNGNILMGGDADLFDGRGGTVNGTIFGGAGDDTFIVDDATTNLSEAAAGGTDEVQSTVGFTLGANFENLTLIGSGHVDGYGNGESNIITGNQGNNVLNGLGSADTLYGGGGDDKVNGGNGIDNLFGGDGDDKLRGQKGADILKADAGDDRLYGGEGNDNLFGGDGNDILKGGMGRDKLYGGDDADVFLFTKAAQSKNDATADKIQDFELGIDTIDLSGVAAGTLTFIAGAAFSGTQGEVQVTGATNSTVLVDVDGDGTADMKISVIGVTGLAEGDFVL